MARCGEWFLFTSCCGTPWRRDLWDTLGFTPQNDAHLLTRDELADYGLLEAVIAEVPMEGYVWTLREFLTVEELIRLASEVGEELRPEDLRGAAFLRSHR